MDYAKVVSFESSLLTGEALRFSANSTPPRTPVGNEDPNCQQRTQLCLCPFYLLHIAAGNGAMNKFRTVVNGAVHFLGLFSFI
jgi:hypothetical protein